MQMSLQKKFDPSAVQLKGYRPFTNRDELLASVRQALQELAPDRHSILVFYGLGGIGKTSLCKRLSEVLTDQHSDVCWARHDFTTPALRDADDALFHMKQGLAKRYQYRFPCFDIAYGEYWAKTRGQTSLTKSELPFLDEGDLLAEILNTVEQVPGIGLVTKIPKVLHKMSIGLRKWWTEFGEDALQGLSELDAATIEERLPGLWALDLKRQVAEDGRRLVLILDTYEALREHQRDENQRHAVDTWVREWVTHLPGVLWIISGRERLYWEDVDSEWGAILSQHPVGDLGDDDARRFLAACRITDRAVQDSIVVAAKGVPYDLDLAVDLHQHISRKGGRAPVPADFGGTPYQIFSRFCKYLDDNEVGALELLAVPRTWDRKLAEQLLQRFGSGFPPQQFTRLRRFSFVKELGGETFTLHARMREALQAHARFTNVPEVHDFLHAYHAELLKGVDDRNLKAVHRRALEEAFHHGTQSGFSDTFAAWFNEACQPFLRDKEWRLLIPLYERALLLVEEKEDTDRAKTTSGEAVPFIVADSLSLFAPDDSVSLFRAQSESVAHRLYDLAAAYQGQGRYTVAEPLARRALRIFESTVGPDHPHVALTCDALAVLYRHQGRYAEAEALLLRALAIREKAWGREHLDVARTLNNLAVMYAYQGRYADAERLHLEVLAIREKQLPADHPEVLLTLNNLAGTYVFRDDLTSAEPLYLRILAVQERDLDSDHPNLAQTLHNLSVLYRLQGRFGEAEDLGNRALQLREGAFGAEHVDVGQSLDALATIYRDTGRCAEAEPIYRRALAIFDGEFGPDHPATMLTISNLAVLYDRTGRRAEADLLHARALRVAEKLGRAHTYASRVKKPTLSVRIHSDGAPPPRYPPPPGREARLLLPTTRRKPSPPPSSALRVAIRSAMKPKRINPPSPAAERLQRAPLPPHQGAAVAAWLGSPPGMSPRARSDGPAA